MTSSKPRLGKVARSAGWVAGIRTILMSIYIQLGTSGSFTAPAAGQLVLQCEDGIRTDNSGSLPVTIAGRALYGGIGVGRERASRRGGADVPVLLPDGRLLERRVGECLV